LKKSDFDFDLPNALIAQSPLAERSASRLLVLDRGAGTRQNRQFRELPGMLQPGDLLVFNDTRVLPARLFGHKESGGAVEILLLTEQWRGAPRSRVHPEPWLDRRRHGRRLRPVQAAWASVS